MKRFVKIRSWHIIARPTATGGYKTRCGRNVSGLAPTSDTFGDEKSCESCLRVVV